MFYRLSTENDVLLRKIIYFILKRIKSPIEKNYHFLSPIDPVITLFTWFWDNWMNFKIDVHDILAGDNFPSMQMIECKSHRLLAYNCGKTINILWTQLSQKWWYLKACLSREKSRWNWYLRTIKYLRNCHNSVIILFPRHPLPTTEKTETIC
jgi:hypothetical protein